MTQTKRSAATRGRRATRISGDDRQEAILTTAETVMATKPFDEISIEDLATGAGISRPTFYFYFSSKDAVLLALLDRVIREVEHRVASLDRDFEVSPAAAWRRSIGAFVEVFTAHSAVSAAAVTARARSHEIHAVWTRAMSSWIDYSTEIIEAERARGAAPEGVPAVDLAAALNLMNERVLTASVSGDQPSVAKNRALDVLSAIWIRSIYATDVL